jgi:hypothetical protein
MDELQKEKIALETKIRRKNVKEAKRKIAEINKIIELLKEKADLGDIRWKLRNTCITERVGLQRIIDQNSTPLTVGELIKCLKKYNQDLTATFIRDHFTGQQNSGGPYITKTIQKERDKERVTIYLEKVPDYLEDVIR